jgi:hypothetical protein
MTATASNFVRVTYSASEPTTQEKATRERLEAAINEAVERFHNETPGQDGLVEIEMYPCDESCAECAA